VGMFGMSLSAGRRGEQYVDGHRTMPAPVSAELQVGRKDGEDSTWFVEVGESHGKRGVLD
jgi:hypothetical protein